MEPSPIAAIIPPAITALAALAAILTPGIALRALMAVLATALTVPTCMMVLMNSRLLSSFLIPYMEEMALTSAISVGDSIKASGKGMGTAPTTTPAVVAAPTTDWAMIRLLCSL